MQSSIRLKADYEGKGAREVSELLAQNDRNIRELLGGFTIIKGDGPGRNTKVRKFKRLMRSIEKKLSEQRNDMLRRQPELAYLKIADTSGGYSISVAVTRYMANLLHVRDGSAWYVFYQKGGETKVAEALIGEVKRVNSIKDVHELEHLRFVALTNYLRLNLSYTLS